MDGTLYWYGVLLAILSGIFANIGLLLQKKVIAKLPDDSKFMKSLVKDPLWLFGLVLYVVISVIFYILAQLYIGPTLVPGLLALGIIILVLGSVKLIGDKLKGIEVMAIILMILAAFLLSFSGLSIAISEKNFLEFGFVVRMSVFTCIVFLLAIFLEIFQKKNEKFRGTFFAIISGAMYSLSDFWISPFLGTITRLQGGIYALGEIFLLVISSIILGITFIIGTIKLQQSFKFGIASNMATIQQVPVNIAPIIVYLLIFLLTPPSVFSIVFLILGSILIIISSYLLAARQVQLEKIKLQKKNNFKER